VILSSGWEWRWEEREGGQRIQARPLPGIVVVEVRREVVGRGSGVVVVVVVVVVVEGGGRGGMFDPGANLKGICGCEDEGEEEEEGLCSCVEVEEGGGRGGARTFGVNLNGILGNLRFREVVCTCRLLRFVDCR